LLQLEASLGALGKRIPVVHTVEILDWAMSGAPDQRLSLTDRAGG
jgi:hypothetical protein